MKTFPGLQGLRELAFQRCSEDYWSMSASDVCNKSKSSPCVQRPAHGTDTCKMGSTVATAVSSQESHCWEYIFQMLHMYGWQDCFCNLTFCFQHVAAPSFVKFAQASVLWTALIYLTGPY